MPKVTATHRLRRREQILKAAIRCFSRRGFHGTSMKDVCHQAKLSPGAVYLYFRSKESIIQALAEIGRGQTAEWLGQCTDLSQVVDLMLQQLNPPEAQQIFQLDVQLWAEAIHTPKLAALFQQSEAVLLDGLAQIAKRASPKRTDQQAQTIARLLIAVMTGLELQKAMKPNVDLGPIGALLKSTLQKV